MRVTTGMVANSVGTNLNNLRRRLARVETEMATGKTILKMGDGPSAGSEVLRLNTGTRTLDQWEANMNDLNGWVASTEGALNHMTNALQRMRELTIQGSTASMSKAALENLSMEVDAIREDLLATSNQKHAGYALFSGHKIDVKAFDFDAATGTTTYNGDSGTTLREIGPGVNIASNVPGSDLSSDLFRVGWEVAEAMRNEDTAAVGNLLTRIDQVLDSVITTRAVVGVRANRLEQAKSQAVDSRVNMTMLLEQAQGVEFERAILELKQVEVAYQTALQVGARIIPPTLVDFMR